MNKEMKRPTSHISGNSIKPALRKAVEFYTDNNRQAYECIHERDEYIDYLESKLSNANPQQALPVVPDFVAEWYEKKKNKLEIAVYSINTSIDKKSFNDLTKIEKWFEGVENKPIETIFKMKDGYTVEKPQLFKIIFPNSTAVLQKDGELNSFADTAYKRYLIKNAMTEQEIKSIDERYWQFAVPVEDGE